MAKIRRRVCRRNATHRRRRARCTLWSYGNTTNADRARSDAPLSVVRTQHSQLAQAAGGGAAVVAAAERAHALRRAAVREGLGLDVAGRAALDRVVADLRCGVERLVYVADLDQAARVGRLRPRAGEAVGLELDGDRAGVAAAEQA